MLPLAIHNLFYATVVLLVNLKEKKPKLVWVYVAAIYLTQVTIVSVDVTVSLYESVCIL